MWKSAFAEAVRLDAFLPPLRRDYLRLHWACQPKLTEENGKPEVSEGWRRERDSNPNNAFL